MKSHETIKWKEIGNVQVTRDSRGNTYYYVGKKHTVEWWYDRQTRNWTIYIIKSGTPQDMDCNYTYLKQDVAHTVNQLANQ